MDFFGSTVPVNGLEKLQDAVERYLSTDIEALDRKVTSQITADFSEFEAQLRGALETGQTTAVELVQAYLARIDAYDTPDTATALNAVVVRQQQTANNGEIVVALLGDEATVKRYSRRNGQVWLLPENEAYSPIDGHDAQILGKVAAVIRRY